MGATRTIPIAMVACDAVTSVCFEWADMECSRGGANFVSCHKVIKRQKDTKPVISYRQA